MVKRLIALLTSALLTCSLLCSCSTVREIMSDRSSGSEGLMIQAAQGSGSLQIERPSPAGTKPADVAEGWTVFVYLCGSDLETDYGAASQDLAEMVGARGSDKVRFIVQTGGAKTWSSKDVKSNQTQRFLIQDGSIMEVDSSRAKDMGDPGTLSDFLSWGLANYPAEHMGVILWNHGGGSLSGVCFDERNSDDALVLRELDQAFGSCFKNAWQKFDFIGFDACLMGTLETANVLASYAQYMIASEEFEPGLGWEYSSIMEHLANHPDCNGAEIGRVICDGYWDALDRASRGEATLSCCDLSGTDRLLNSFYRFSQELYSASEDQQTLASMVRGVRGADNFGGNNWSEGYTNMVDLAGLVQACSGATPSAQEVLSDLASMVTYQVRGSAHAEAGGLSLYYPLQVAGSEELAAFEQVTVNPAYLSFVDRLCHGATYNGGAEYQDYSDMGWFANGVWNWLFGDETETETGTGTGTNNYWNYVDEHERDSQLVTFAEAPHVDADGMYTFTLDKDGIDNTSNVTGVVYYLSDDGEWLIRIGETDDVYGSWKTGTFTDGFDGQWLTLPDGQPLCIEVVGYAADYVVYTAPIRLNGEDTNLRFRQSREDGSTMVEGTWDGVMDSGASDRSIKPLSDGDVIVPLYDTLSMADDDDSDYWHVGNEYTVRGELGINYGPLKAGSYFYQFLFEDVFGDWYYTDIVEFDIDSNGGLSYTEL